MSDQSPLLLRRIPPLSACLSDLTPSLPPYPRHFQGVVLPSASMSKPSNVWILISAWQPNLTLQIPLLLCGMVTV
ncbi:unnamed protein product [Protopolystoma xenopodis]|uniref:Uncharacterized protein n=1 Tax=Protopolystoma xenopodis TaxID=117903 RepID=A0A3S4ZKA1_9PLAT|nr:unnamed protein product [Protopolystoma xenopodis]